MKGIQYLRKGYVNEKKEFVINGIFKVTVEQITRSPKRGVLVATGPGKVGYVIRARNEKRRDWDWAKDLATKRANDPDNYPNPPIQKWMQYQFDKFVERSYRMFQ